MRISRFLIFYFSCFFVAAVFFIWIQSQGYHLQSLEALTGFDKKVQEHMKFSGIVQFLLSLTTVMITARVVGFLFEYLKQPPVVGEVIGGLLLGPSCFSYFFPDVIGFLIPGEVMPFLSIIAQLGIILFMFLVGLELDLKALRKSGQSTLLISHLSILLPFVMGSGLGLILYKKFAPVGVPFLPFSLFMGVAMSVTAFPVLARILSDFNWTQTTWGRISLASAAIDDVTAWCLLAIVVSMTQANWQSAVITILLSVAYIIFMFVVARPLFNRIVPLIEKFEKVTRSAMSVTFGLLMLSALATEFIGIHALFGAFIFGVVIPHESRLAQDLRNKLEDFITVLFLPAFFAYTGLRTQVQLVQMDHLSILLLICMVAIVGKVVGSYIGGYLSGLSWKDSLSVGVLMNTRGLVELIVLNLGLDLGILSPELFAMLVIMAVVTTMLTSPALRLLHWRRLEF